MFSDPLFDWVHHNGFSPVLIWLLLFIASVLFTHLLVYLAHGKKSKEWKALRKDPTENYYWPILLFGGTAAAFVLIGNLDLQLRENFARMGFDFVGIEAVLDPNLIFPISTVAALGIALFSAVRFTKKGIPKWLVGSRWVLLTKALLVSTPMGIWTITTLVRLLNHVSAFYQFGQSSWVPTELYHADGAFGLEWLRITVQIELVLLLIFSFMPLVMMTQIKKLKRINLYTLLSASGLLVIIFGILPIILGLDQKFEAINAHWFERTTEELAPFFDVAAQQEALAVKKAGVYEQRLAHIAQLPDSLGSVPFFQLALSVAGNLLSLGYDSLAGLFGFDLAKLLPRGRKAAPKKRKKKKGKD